LPRKFDFAVGIPTFPAKRGILEIRGLDWSANGFAPSVIKPHPDFGLARQDFLNAEFRE
jgi:hypothetical protein